MFSHSPIEQITLESAHSDGKHFYSKDNIKYPSITTILHSFPNPGIEKWKYNTPNWREIQEESMTVGTSMHKMIELFLKNEPIINDNDIAYDLFVNMQSYLSNINNIICQEYSMYDPNLRVAGTVDCIAEYNGVLSVIDFKNSRKKKFPSMVKKSGYYEQLNAYARMFEFCHKKEIEQGVVLISSWDGTVKDYVINIPDYNENLDSILDLYYSV